MARRAVKPEGDDLPRTEVRDWGADLARMESRIKEVEEKPAPWWHYAILAGVAVMVVFGSAIMEVVRGRFADFRAGR